MMTPNPPAMRAGLIRGYRLVLFLSSLGILVVTGVGALIQERNEYQTELAALKNDFAQNLRSLSSSWQEYEEAIDAVRLKAEVFLAREDKQTNAELARWILRNGPGVPFDLDEVPAPYDVRHIGNVTGQVDKIDEDLLRELLAALYLNDRYGGLAYSFPDIKWLYYTSKRGFMNLYPWVASSDYRYREMPTNKSRLADLWTGVQDDGLPGQNLYDQARRWLDVHPDDAGKGLVLTVAQPVFDGGKVIGTAALDVSLAPLRARLRDWQADIGTYLVVTQDGQVIAASTGLDAAERTAEMADFVPADLREQIDVRTPTNGLQVVDGYIVQSAPIASAPINLVSIIPLSAVYQKIFAGDLLILIAGLGGILVMLFVAIWVTDRRLIQPSMRLIDFIYQESRNEEHPPPKVPLSWQPSFDAVQQAFDSYREMVSLHQELEVARSIQQSILPKRRLERPEVDIGWRVRTAKEVGGDFYDFFELSHDHIGIAIADVSGKGVPGALFMAITRTLLRAEARQVFRPARTLARLNAQLARDNEATTFVTLFFGVLDLSSGRFVYANAGHLPPLLMSPEGEVYELPNTGGLPVGMIAGSRYVEHQTRLQPGSSLFLYTDGLTEAFDSEGNQFGDDRLLELFSGAAAAADTDALLDRVLAAVSGHIGRASQSDDWTCVLLRFLGETPVDRKGDADRRSSDGSMEGQDVEEAALSD